jgi:hypothetical protein
MATARWGHLGLWRSGSFRADFARCISRWPLCERHDSDLQEWALARLVERHDARRLGWSPGWQPPAYHPPPIGQSPAGRAGPLAAAPGRALSAESR